MLLSLVLPVYNCAAWLPQCLNSVLAAKLTDFEMVLVDDGSTDNSRAVAEAYAETHPMIRVLSQPNSGPSAARNAGLRQCRGDFVAFLDSDDYLLPEAFAETVSLLARYEADLWVSDFFRVTGDGAVVDRIEQIAPADEPVFGRAAMRRFVSSGDCVWNVWRCIFRRSFLEAHGLCFREGFHCGEDMEFMIRALTLAERIAFFHNPYYCYRVNYGGTLMLRYTAERVRQLTEMMLSSARHLDGLDGEPAASLKRMLAREYLLNLSLYRQCPPEERAEALRWLKGAQTLAAHADSGAYRCAAAFVSLFGIPLSSALLLAAKRLRRQIRKHEQRAPYGL